MERQTRNQMLRIMISVKNGLIYFQKTNQYIIIKKCIAALRSIDELCTTSFSQKRAKYYNNAIKLVILKLSHLQEGQSALNFSGNALIKSLDIISDQLKHDREIKKEIIFLPYKASMWDSLESIWQAAAEDKEHCDAYVIPIPYCDRNPDGTPAQWHYEADQFPNYVPITDFKKYNLAEHHPDVIFIHNPYDGYNRVTSVDSKYYSSELKKYTDMLVYVPYFVVGDTIESHFCQAPAVVNADKVIVQSEEIKQQYEAYYPGGNPPKGKILALGSPKFDKVLTSKKEDFILPENWKKIINGRKIILYNTSLGAMLQNSDKVNAKLRYVFSVFKGRDDVVLWWRPHPLMKATMESMRPEILQEYLQIEQEYKNAGWGIYDDTADLHRAITWSDAYYGDWSSVVWLYKVTGKTILIQQFLEKGYYPYFSHVEMDSEFLWYMSCNINGLFQINISNGDTEFFEININNKKNNELQYRVIKKIGDNLILFPYLSNDILQFDISKKTFKRKLIINIKNYTFSNIKIMVCVRYKNYIFAFSNCAVIIKYDFENNLYESNNIPFKYMKTDIFGASYVINKKNILLPILGTNKILIFNMETEIYKIEYVGKYINRYSAISFDGDCYWLLQDPLDNIIKWERKKNKIWEYSNEVIDSNKGTYLFFTALVFAKNKIIIFPGLSNQMLFINKTTGKISYINLNNKDKKSTLNYEFAETIDNGKIIALNRNRGMIEVFSNLNGKKQYPISVPTELVRSIIRKKLINYLEMGNNVIIVEDIWQELTYLLDYVNSLHKNHTEILLNNNAGGKIYNLLKMG